MPVIPEDPLLQGLQEDTWSDESDDDLSAPPYVAVRSSKPTHRINKQPSSAKDVKHKDICGPTASNSVDSNNMRNDFRIHNRMEEDIVCNLARTSNDPSVENVTFPSTPPISTALPTVADDPALPWRQQGRNRQKTNPRTDGKITNKTANNFALSSTGDQQFYKPPQFRISHQLHHNQAKQPQILQYQQPQLLQQQQQLQHQQQLSWRHASTDQQIHSNLKPSQYQLRVQQLTQQQRLIPSQSQQNSNEYRHPTTVPTKPAPAPEPGIYSHHLRQRQQNQKQLARGEIYKHYHELRQNSWGSSGIATPPPEDGRQSSSSTARDTAVDQLQRLCLDALDLPPLLS